MKNKSNTSHFGFSLIEDHIYPKFPYNPPAKYLEFDNFDFELDNKNQVYSTIRNLLVVWGYDSENLGKKLWNPFRRKIKNDGLVLIKPNLVYEEPFQQNGRTLLTTHSSILRPILDYLMLLQKSDNLRFKTVIGDVPLQSANWEKIVKQNKLCDLVNYYKANFDFVVDLIDLRKEIAIKNDNGFITERMEINGDPSGYKNIHLKESFLDEIIGDYKKFSIADYDTEDTSQKHAKSGEHYYHIPQTVLDADLFINVPKIKTHQKAGVTLALKNLIGINGDKSWIPHYRKGAKKFGGDEFSNENYILKYANTITRRILQGKNRVLWNFLKSINFIIKKRILKKRKIEDFKGKIISDQIPLITGGAWSGNDTLWRSIFDLNRLLFYADKHGKIKNSVQKEYLTICDGVIAGEGDGPLKPLPKNTGLITLSENPVYNDICCSHIMGFKWEKIAQLRNTTRMHELFQFDGNTEVLNVISISGNSKNKIKFKDLPNLNFIPPPGWINQIERSN